MSLYGLGTKPWTCIYGGVKGDCDTCNVSGCPISSKTIKFGKIPDDCWVKNCMRCPRSLDGSCSYIMGDDVPLTENKWWTPPPPPSVACCQRCASCWRAPTCEPLKEHFEFAKEISAPDSFKKICATEDRSKPHFHDCLNCKEILTCKILRRSMTPLE